jgi:hypothetical protein
VLVVWLALTCDMWQDMRWPLCAEVALLPAVSSPPGHLQQGQQGQQAMWIKPKICHNDEASYMPADSGSRSSR